MNWEEVPPIKGDPARGLFDQQCSGPMVQGSVTSLATFVVQMYKEGTIGRGVQQVRPLSGGVTHRPPFGRPPDLPTMSRRDKALGSDHLLGQTPRPPSRWGRALGPSPTAALQEATTIGVGLPVPPANGAAPMGTTVPTGAL